MRKIVLILAPLFITIFIFFTIMNFGGYYNKHEVSLALPAGVALVTTTAKVNLEGSVKRKFLDLNANINSNSHINENEVVELVTSVYKKLPTQEQAQLLSDDETHDTPEIIWQAADQLAKVAGYLDKHPESKKVINDFYRRCAETKEFLNSVRALCHQHTL